LQEKSTALGLPINHSLNQSESILFHGDVALIAIKAGLNDNGALRHEVGGDASGDPRIGRLTRTGRFAIEVRNH